MCAENKSKQPNHTCPSCGRRFYCHEAEGCWCEKITLTRMVLAMLRRRYINCLCENCLHKHSLSQN